MLGLSILGWTHLQAQKEILGGEYFWNTDPGQGSGTPLQAMDGNFDQALENLFSNGLTPPLNGINKFYVRLKDDCGNWGPVFSRAVSYLDTLQTPLRVAVTQAEYFWDTDPGAGSGTVLLAFDGNFNEALEDVFASSTTLPGAGIHLFAIRVRDEGNNWGPVYKRVISLNDNLNTPRAMAVTSAEYFWDTDPGAGSGTTLLAFDGNFNEALEDVFTSSAMLPGAGIHLFGIRVRDEGGEWGPVFKRVISLNDNLNTPRALAITSAEYFWDADPGAGSGTAMLAYDGNFNEAMEAVFTSAVSLPGQGIHLFGIRVRDESNAWGPVFKRVISINDNLNTPRPLAITSAEYFWDTDPGAGSGTPMLAMDGNFNEALEVVFANTTSLPAVGTHLFALRVRDESGNWGPVYKRIIGLNDNLNGGRPLKITAAEYFWGLTDPGPGNGYPLFAMDGNFDQAMEVVFDSNATLTYKGMRLFNIRLLDEYGQWGPVYKRVISINVPYDVFNLELFTPDTTICQGDSIRLNAKGAGSYTWSPSTGLNTNLGPEVLAKPTVTTTYTVIGQGAPGEYDTLTVTITVKSGPTVDIGNDTTICNGNSVVLNPGSSFLTYLWSDNSTADTLVADTAGSFWVSVTDTSGCPGRDTLVVTLDTTFNPGVTPAGPVDLCQGQTVTLQAAIGLNSYLWNNGSTADHIVVDTAGAFIVAVGDTSGCNGVSDTVFVNLRPVPTVMLDPSGPVDTCAGYTVTLHALAGPNLSFLWSTGDTLDSLVAAVSGNYWVQVTDSNACTFADTALVRIGQVPPHWTDLVGAVSMNDTLFKTVNANGWSNSGAASVQVLQPGDDGYLLHVVHTIKDFYFIGLSEDNPDAANLTIDHAFYVNKKQLRVRESIGTDLVVGTLDVGDSIAIARVGTTLNWLHNGVVVYSTPADTSKSLLADVSIYKKNSYLTNIWVSFCETTLPLTLEFTQNYNRCALGPEGQIILMPAGGTPPYSYLWSTGDTTAVLDSLEAGHYSVVITDLEGSNISQSFEIFNRISWTELVGATSVDDTLSRSVAGNSWGTCGARSEQVLQPNTDGVFMHVVHRTDKYYYIGLSNLNPDVWQTTIDYAFYVAKGALSIREEAGYFASHGSISIGDTLKVERAGSNIRYFRNSTLLKTTPAFPGDPLFVDATIFNAGVSLYDNYTSFCGDSIPPDSFVVDFVVSHSDCYPAPNGGIVLNVSGGIPPYTYSWSSGETVSSISGKAAGAYTAIVHDQMGNSDTLDFEIMNRTVWEGFVNAAANGDTLYRTLTSTNSWGNSGARSDNKLLNGLSGKVLHIVNSIDYNYYLGLSDSDPNASQFTIDYAFYNNKGLLFIREEQSGFFQQYGTVAVGDSLVIERSVASMYWYQNGNQLRSIGVSPAETLRVDVSMYSKNTHIHDVFVNFCDTVAGQKNSASEGASSEGQSNALQAEIRVYPNPNQGAFTVEIPGQEGEALEIWMMDLRGREIFRTQLVHPGGVFRKDIQLQAISKGVYLLKVRTPDGEEMRKLMIEE